MEFKQDPHELHENQIEPLLMQDGLTCSIDNNRVSDRKLVFDTIISQGIHTTKENGYHILKFNYNQNIAHLILDFIIKEQECCKFFDFDLLFRKRGEIIEFRISSKDLSSDKLDKVIDTMIKS